MPWRGRAAAPVATFLVLIAAGCSSRRSLPANKLDLIARGDELVKSHQYANAITIYQKAAAIDPVDGTVRMKLAGVYASAGNPMEASTQAMRALDLMPNDAGTRLHVAELMLSASRFIDAADVVAPLRYNPDNADALILWGNATARLFNTTWALYSLADPIRSPTDFDRARLALRQAVTSYEDRAAEQAFRQALALAPDNTDASLALADFLWATGRAVEAEPLLKRVADQMPKHAAVNHALGSYYLSRHQDAEGERYLRNAASADAPYNRAPRFTLAGYYVQVKRDDDALAVLEAMTGEDDAKGAVSLRIAAIHVRHGRGDEALRALGPLLTREPNNADALALEARALVTNNKAHDALGVAEAAVKADPDSSNAKLALGKALAADGDLEGALDPLLEALRLHPADPQIPPTLARTALATGRDNLALLYGRQALRNDPSDRDTALAVVTALIHLHDYSAAENELRALQSRDERSPEVFVDQGTILAARGNQSGARAAYQHALELDGNSLEALTGLVSVDLDDRQIPTARRRVEEALTRHPDDPSYLRLASRVYSAAGETTMTESTLRRVLDLDHASVSTALMLVNCLVAQGRFVEAKRVIDQELARHPSSTQAQIAEATLLQQMGLSAQAQARYESIVARSPDATRAMLELAALYVNRNEKLDVAMSLVTKARQQSPYDPAIGDALGWIYLRKGLSKMAVPLFEDAVKSDPRNPVYVYHLGMAHLEAHRRQQAREELTQALQLDGSFPDRAKARAALASLTK